MKKIYFFLFVFIMTLGIDKLEAQTSSIVQKGLSFESPNSMGGNSLFGMATSQTEKTVALRNFDGEFVGWDPAYPLYSSGPFVPIITGQRVPILPKSQSGIGINCLNSGLTPSVPAGDWIKGKVSLHMSDWIKPLTQEAVPWDGYSPNGVFVSLKGPSEIVIDCPGTVQPLNMTRYWWIPASKDGEMGFILAVF